MANQKQTLWLVLALILLGGVALYLSMNPIGNTNNQVVMKDVFTQQASAPTAKQAAPQGDPVPSPAIVTSPEGGKEAGFAVQVYSFKDQLRANKVLESLKSKGFENAYVEISDLGERGIWYRVRIGGLKDELKAQAMLENVRKNFDSAIIVKSKS